MKNSPDVPTSAPVHFTEPDEDCAALSAARAFRAENRQRLPLGRNAPAPSFRRARRAASDRRARARSDGAISPAGPLPAISPGSCSTPRCLFWFRRGPLWRARRRRPAIRRRPHCQRRALRAAAEQADARGNSPMPPFLARKSRPCRNCAPFYASAASPMTASCARSAKKAAPFAHGAIHHLQSAACRSSTAIIARATTPTRAC